MKIISKEEFDRIQEGYKGIFEDFQETHPEWKGRRTAFLPGEGTTLSIEGIHCLVDGDYSHLPVLTKANACVGACYQFAGGYTFVKRIYRLSEAQARQEKAVYLDRVETDSGDFALPGSDIRSDLCFVEAERLDGEKIRLICEQEA